jgi:hypothetical protein
MFVNLTPHEVTLVNDQGDITLVIKPEGTPARCAVKREIAFIADGISVNKSVFGEVVGLPEPIEGTWYIVSRIVAEAAQRSDLLVPDETVRNQEGQIVGCKSFATV